jgi:Holliday junction resolvase-like predicted endonuclease
LLDREEKLPLRRRGDICGNATENVIRNHLLSKGLNISRTRVRIESSWIEIDVLSLKGSVSPEKSEYSPSEVNTILEIKNNAVADQTTIIRNNFDKLRQIARDMRFAVIVLSEREGYKHAIKEEKLGYPVFTLISRRVAAGSWMWSKNETLNIYNKTMRRGKWAGRRAIQETGQWSNFITYLGTLTQEKTTNFTHTFP